MLVLLLSLFYFLCNLCDSENVCTRSLYLPRTRTRTFTQFFCCSSLSVLSLLSLRCVTFRFSSWNVSFHCGKIDVRVISHNANLPFLVYRSRWRFVANVLCHSPAQYEHTIMMTHRFNAGKWLNYKSPATQNNGAIFLLCRITKTIDDFRVRCTTTHLHVM